MSLSYICRVEQRLLRQYGWTKIAGYEMSPIKKIGFSSHCTDEAGFRRDRRSEPVVALHVCVAGDYRGITVSTTFTDNGTRRP